MESNFYIYYLSLFKIKNKELLLNSSKTENLLLIQKNDQMYLIDWIHIIFFFKLYFLGFKPVFMPKINKRSPVHILPNQNGRHLPPLTPPPRPVYPRRRPTQQPPTSTSSTTELSTNTESSEDNTTTTLDYEVSQGNARLDSNTILIKKTLITPLNTLFSYTK